MKTEYAVAIATLAGVTIGGAAVQALHAQAKPRAYVVIEIDVMNQEPFFKEFVTTAEIERLMAAARKSSRYGHRDATMILIGYRHGLRASELCDLQWSQVELATGRLHVRRAKNGSPSVHPMQATRYARCGICSVNRGHPVTYFSLNAAGR
jgi:integrase